MIKQQPIVIDSYLKMKLHPSTLEQGDDGIVFGLKYYTLSSEDHVVVPCSDFDRRLFREYRWAARNYSRISKVVHGLTEILSNNGKMTYSTTQKAPRTTAHANKRRSSPRDILTRANKKFLLLRARLGSLEWNLRKSASIQAVFSAPIQMFSPPAIASWFPGGANVYFGYNPANYHFLFNGSIWISDVSVSSEELLDAIAAKSMRAEKRLQRENAGGQQPSDRHISQAVRIEVWRRDGGKCVRCSSRNRIEFDHIIPVIEGGGSTARNVELLCEACNRAKSCKVDG